MEYCGCVGFPNVGIGGRRYITDRRNNVRIRREKRNNVQRHARTPRITEAAIGGANAGYCFLLSHSLHSSGLDATIASNLLLGREDCTSLTPALSSA